MVTTKTTSDTKPTKKKKSGKSFRLVKKSQRPPVNPVTTTRQLIKQTLQTVKQNWKLLLGLGLLYALLYKIFVEGAAKLDLSGLKDIADGSAVETVGNLADVTSTAAGFKGGGDTSQSLFATLLTVLFALCVVWGLRQAMAGNKVRIRDALYNGCAPFFSTLVLLAIILVQMVPLAIGVFLYVVARSLDIIHGGVEDMLFFFVAAFATLLSCYWLSASLIGLMAATAPGMYPLAALKIARGLVAYRRWHVFMRIAVFGLLLTIFWFLMIVLLAAIPVIGSEVVLLLRAFSMVIVVAFVYQLYRALIDDADEQAASA